MSHIYIYCQWPEEDPYSIDFGVKGHDQTLGLSFA